MTNINVTHLKTKLTIVRIFSQVPLILFVLIEKIPAGKVLLFHVLSAFVLFLVRVLRMPLSKCGP